MKDNLTNPYLMEVASFLTCFRRDDLPRLKCQSQLKISKPLHRIIDYDVIGEEKIG